MPSSTQFLDAYDAARFGATPEALSHMLKLLNDLENHNG
jgi:hypothetical protein